MLSLPNNLLRDLVIVDWESFCGKLLATKVVLILSSDGLPKSLFLVMRTLKNEEISKCIFYAEQNNEGY